MAVVFAKTLLRFFRFLGKDRTKKLQFICSDMWQGYLKVIYKQAMKLSESLRYNLKSIRSHLMKEDFQQFWEYSTAGWAGKFLDQWCTLAMKSKMEPMKKIAKSFRSKRELILNWFRAGGTLSSGSVQGFNNKVKLVTRKSYS